MTDVSIRLADDTDVIDGDGTDVVGGRPASAAIDRADAARADAGRAGSKRAGSEQAGSEQAGSEQAGSERIDAGAPDPGRADDERTDRERTDDEADLNRAVQAYRLFFGSVCVLGVFTGRNAGAMPEVQRRLFAALDPAPDEQAGEGDAPYVPLLIDLRDGPAVIELPPGPLAGVAVDLNLRWILDMGLPGPDAGAGGRHLLLPPGWQGEVPPGCHFGRSSAYRVLAGIRAFPAGGDVAAVRALLKAVTVRPLGRDGAEHGLAGNEPAGHEPTGRDSTGHDPTGHRPAVHDPTGYEPTGYEPTGHEPTGYGSAMHDSTGHGPAGHEPTGHEPAARDRSLEAPAPAHRRWEDTIGYWEALHEVLETEPPFRGFRTAYRELAALGIARGRPFAPDARMTGILERAARIGRGQLRPSRPAGGAGASRPWPGAGPGPLAAAGGRKAAGGGPVTAPGRR